MNIWTDNEHLTLGGKYYQLHYIVAGKTIGYFVTGSSLKINYSEVINHWSTK